MSLTLDTTVGGENTNSYASLSDAETYFEARFVSGAGWSGFTEQQKIARLIAAARVIDRFLFLGKPTDDDQALAFPRKQDFVCTDEVWSTTDSRLKILGRYYDTDAIPNEIKWGQLELALVIFDDDGYIESGNPIVTSETLGKWTITYRNVQEFRLASEMAFQFIAPFVKTSHDTRRE